MTYLVRSVLLLLSFATLASGGRAGVLEDRAIEDAMNSSYVFRHVLADRSMVQVYVRYGQVELSGQVLDEEERALVVRTLTAIPHVVRVESRLFVDSADRRSSQRWKLVRLRADLMMQQDIDVTRTRIALVKGNWILTGTVPSSEQANLIESRIRVLAPSAPVSLAVESETPTAASIDDASIIAMVQHAIDQLDLGLPSPPVVKSANGRLEITGSTDRADVIARISAAADATRGVRSVQNRMTLDRAEKLSPR